jgi:hypothetical protein
MSVPSQPTVPSSANEQPVHVPMTLSTATSPVMEYNATLSPLPVALPPSRYPIAADQFQPNAYNHTSQSPGPGSDGGSDGRPRTADAASSQAHLEASFPNNYPLYNWSMPYKPNAYGNQHSSGIPLLPPLAYFYRPHRLDSVAPRERIMHIIGLFFDFVYPLTPCVHRPSFMADLANRREERDPLFFALVMSTVASTLVQAPRSYIPMDRPSVRRLAQACHEASRQISVASYDPPTSMMVVIRYLYVRGPLDICALANLFVPAVTPVTTFARVTTLRHTLLLGRRPTSQSPCICTRRLRTRVWIPSSARFAGGRSGCCSMRTKA